MGRFFGGCTIFSTISIPGTIHETHSACHSMWSPVQVHSCPCFPPVRPIWCLHWLWGNLYILSEVYFCIFKTKTMSALAGILFHDEADFASKEIVY